ncbi:MAG TPA: hypothetical protein VHY22_02985 [Chthoniobacteraceae bacterium]|jgi:hypothetical protein|nr:hypothetical protein [Chthoniobacteraceae bacterium]
MHHSGGRRCAFTIVEILVSVVVLVLIMVMVGQLMNGAAVGTTLSGKHVDADSQARMVFDRMAVDFSHMPQQKDVDFIFSKQPDPSAITTSGSSDKMFFYSEAPAYFDTSAAGGLYPASTQPDPKSSVSLIGYAINSGVNNSGGITPPAYCLQRLSRGLVWDTQNPAVTSPPGAINFLTFPNSNSTTPLPVSTLAGNPFTSGVVGSPPSYDGTDASYDVIGDQVFRMEFCFQVKDLSNPSVPASAYSNYPLAHFAPGSANQSTESTVAPPAPAVGDRWYDKVNNRAFICTGSNSQGTTMLPVWKPNGMADVCAIVVAIATLDTNSRKVVSSQQLASLSAYLQDPTETELAQNPPELMAQLWQATVNNPDFPGETGVPASVAGQVRIYQRFFDLVRN